MKAILHKDINKKNILTYTLKDEEELRQELNGVFVDVDSLNIDYIDAYEIKGEEVPLDLEKAKEIKVNKIRIQRDEFFVDFDKRYDIAFKDEIDLTELKVERQRLKDAPQKAEEYLSSCFSFDDIESLNLLKLI